MRALMVLAALAVVGCPSTAQSPVCTHLETRCENNVAQICDTQGRWEDVMDCSGVVPGQWQCEQDGDDHTCVRGEQ